MQQTQTIRLFRGIGKYLVQRFPPVAYTILVAIFFLSSNVVWSRVANSSNDVYTILQQCDSLYWSKGVVLWLFFLHLRIFDEFKDYLEDRWNYPDRVLSKGEISLSILGRLGFLAVFLQILLSWMVGIETFVAWLCAFLFSVAMRFEFGVSSFLKPRMVLYAITHNPVIAFLAVFSVAGYPDVQTVNGLYGYYILSVSLSSLAFEIARKMRQPHEEIPNVPSYTSTYGIAKTLLWYRMTILLSTTALGYVLWVSHSQSLWAWGCLGLALVGGLSSHSKSSSKKFELAGTVFLLLSMLAMVWM